jgi:hypothetical protein
MRRMSVIYNTTCEGRTLLGGWIFSPSTKGLMVVHGIMTTTTTTDNDDDGTSCIKQEVKPSLSLIIYDDSCHGGTPPRWERAAQVIHRRRLLDARVAFDGVPIRSTVTRSLARL